jgi:hypothetical protein
LHLGYNCLNIAEGKYQPQKAWMDLPMETLKKVMERRTFLKTGLGCASLALSDGLGGIAFGAEPAGETSQKKMPTRILGRTEIGDVPQNIN